MKPISHYQYEKIFKVHTDTDGKEYFNMYNTLHIDDDIDPALYYEYTFTLSDLWTKMAHEIYGDTRLWWIICLTNKIDNPLKLPKPGTILKILKPNVVSSILSDINNGRLN